MADGPPTGQQGYIKVSRKAYESDPFWLEPREFSRWEAWEYMIAEAAFKAKKWTDGQKIIELQRGETRPLSLRHLANEWGWTVKKVRVFLDLIMEDGRIRAQQETAQGHTYLLVNYRLYQGRGHSKGTAKGTAGAQAGHNTKKGRKDESNDSSNWVSAVVDVWADKAGKANAGRIGKALKPIREKYETDVIVRVLTFYLDSEDPQYLSVERFAEAFVKWGEKAKEARNGQDQRGGTKPRAWDYSDATGEFEGFNEPDDGDTGSVSGRNAA